MGAIYWHPLPLLLASFLLLAGPIRYVLLFLPQDIPDEASDRRPIVTNRIRVLRHRTPTAAFEGVLPPPRLT